MATWKKVVVSGSNISQLSNDANYLTAGTLIVPNSFSTASFDGTALIANSLTGSLNFASSSGQGLTILADAGTDTLTFGLSAIPNASLANSAITIAGTSTSLGGSISAATILTSTGVVSGSGQVAALLPVGTVSGSALSSPSQGTAVLTTNGVAGSTIGLGVAPTDSPSFVNLSLTGDLTVLGTTTTIQTNNLLVEDQFILVSSGSANNSTDGGIIVDRGIYAAGNTALGYDATTFRWGLQNGLADPTNTVDLGAASGGVSGSFLAHVFTEAVHGATKPTAGEFAVQGAIYTSTAEDIWIYS
jgi:hypothetical protein